MSLSSNIICLMGFKHVGKSIVGKALAKRLQRAFVDLDSILEKNYQDKYKKQLSCREIYKQYGEIFFNELEFEALKMIIPSERNILALGGGTPLNENNQLLLQSTCLIHLQADPDVVYERIMASGIPAFFPTNLPPRVAFDILFQQRNKIYAKLATLTIDNNATIENTVNQIVSNLR